MDNIQFEQVFEEQVDRSRKVLVDKAREYADDVDRLHNFKISAALTGETEKQALAGFMVKHTTSIYDMIRLDQEYTAAQWDEKITDHINYLILLKALVVEESTDTGSHISTTTPLITGSTLNQ